MALSREIASQIVEIVAQDPDCRRFIQDDLSKVFPDSWGITGSYRNAELLLAATLAGENTADAPWESWLCTGVARVSTRAVRTALKEGKLADVHGVECAERERYGVLPHSATCVKMSDQSEYVFDWHATLSLENPLVFEHDEWKTATGGVAFEEFTGY